MVSGTRSSAYRCLFSELVVMLGLVVVLTGISRGFADTAPGEFSVAREGTPIAFPRDHGAHGSYQTEWWYYTGQLYAPGKKPFVDRPRYGFQLTFFRRANVAGAAFTQDYLAHGALTDIEQQRTFFASRIGGGALGVAGVSESTLMAWSGDWTADLIGRSHLLRYSVPLEPATDGSVQLRIVGMSDYPEWLHGTNGFSRKGPCPSCASIYYSFPALRLEANVVRGHTGGGLEQMHGVGWMDHEFMSRSLDKALTGWDWMGLMFRDGRQLMLFRLRGAEGSSDYVSGSLRGPAGAVQLAPEEISITPLERWRSPQTGTEYPIVWKVELPAHGISTVVSARVPTCEVGGDGAPEYWEGPVASSDEAVLGYLEMTGYSAKISF